MKYRLFFYSKIEHRKITKISPFDLLPNSTKYILKYNEPMEIFAHTIMKIHYIEKKCIYSKSHFF